MPVFSMRKWAGSAADVRPELLQRRAVVREAPVLVHGVDELAVAVVLGIGTILAVVAFIDHSAHAMDVSEILERIRRESTDQIRAEWTPTEPGAVVGDPWLPPRSAPTTAIRSRLSIRQSAPKAQMVSYSKPEVRYLPSLSL